MSNFTKIFISILFFLCLLDMPYGYYQLVRFVSMIGFAILGYNSFKQERKVEFIIYCALILLFQPFQKIALGRIMWNIVDVIVGLALLLSIWIKKEKVNNYK